MGYITWRFCASGAAKRTRADDHSPAGYRAVNRSTIGRAGTGMLYGGAAAPVRKLPSASRVSRD